jgi:hypothetical protein
VRVAVNLSPVQFRSRGLVGTVTGALAAAGLCPSRLELEITEAVLLQDDEGTIAALHQLRALGVRISMDDFGTGYSSLSYLRSFPFDKIKIDRSFIADLDRSKDSAAIIRAIAGLGASLGIETTAEGVETAEQFERVRRDGCTEIQGYFFGPPCAAERVFRTFADWRRDKAVGATKRGSGRGNQWPPGSTGLFVGGDVRLVGQSERNVIEAIDEAVLGVLVDLEALIDRAVTIDLRHGDSLRRQIDCDFDRRVGCDRGMHRAQHVVGHLDAHHTDFPAVGAEDVGKRRRDDHFEARILQRPGSMLS